MIRKITGLLLLIFAMASSPMVRAQSAYYNYIDTAEMKIKKAMKIALPARKEIEQQLYQDALNKVYEVHPEWKAENK